MKNIDLVAIYPWIIVAFNLVLIAVVYVLRRENKVLKKQIHHRIKNNLQLFHSLINLQLKYNNDSNVSNELGESKKRFLTLSFFNKFIIQRCKIAKDFDVNDFSNILTNYIIVLHERSYPGFKKICNINFTSSKLNVEQVVSFGLLINEILLFICKHKMFSLDKNINITFYPTSKNTYHFSLENEHFEKNWISKFEKTISEKIITRLSNQLESDIQVKNTDEMSFVLQF